MMKQITFFLTDGEWKELVDTVRHESGEAMSEEEIKRKMRDDITAFIQSTYIHSLGV
jgi:hypothetical protein